MNPICIAGMHRSGTSMVTRMLNLAGLYLGPEEQIMPAAKENPEGFWENLDFVAINEEILNLLGGAWDYIPQYPPDWTNSMPMQLIRPIAEKHLRNFTGHEFWGWKDPRNCLTFPFWKSLLPGVKVIVSLRDPREVAQSLRQRNGFSYTLGLHLWYHYNRILLDATQPEERLVTHYDAFFHNPEAELRRILGWLGVELSPEEQRRAVSAISPKIRHFKSPEAPIFSYPQFKPVFHLYDDLCREAGGVYQEFVARYPGSLPKQEKVNGKTAEAELMRVQNLIRNGQQEAALQRLQEIVARYPKSGLAHNELAAIYYQKGDKKSALHHFENAVQFDPQNMIAKMNLADLYAELGENERALELFVEILKEKPDDLHTLLQAGQLYFLLGFIEESAWCYEEVLRRDPENQIARESLEYQQTERQKAAKASTSLDESGSEEQVLPEIYPQSPPASEVKVSIIIPVFNKVEFTRQCIETLYQNTPGDAPEFSFEVIVVDNGSTDDTKTFLKEAADKYPNFYYVINPDNLGFSRACNIGAHYARGKYLHFLNNDTEPLPNWLPPLVEVLDVDETVGATGSKLLFPDGTIQHAGVVVVENHILPDHLLARHFYYKKPGDYPETNGMRTYKVLTAASLMIRREIFQKVGGFDEGYWNGYEDVDLCFKIYQDGWKLIYQPHSVLIHYEQQSGAQRFIKVSENVKRLHERWLGKIKPDLILKKDNHRYLAKERELQPYSPPRELTSVKDSPDISAMIAERFQPRETLVSIVILTFNQLDRTKECLASIEKHTGIPHEVIVVDNGSTDGTVNYLRKWAKKHDNFHLIVNKTNKGFAAGNNQGIEQAKGDYVVLLNNDVVVSEGWLEGMLSAFEKDSTIGLVGPMTNYISGEQMEPDAAYKDLAEFEAFARNYRVVHKDQVNAVVRLVGFCLMIKREVIEKIGLLDERFGKGNFEDDDYCLRASIAGYKLALAREVFVHHYGSSTFKGNKINYQKMLDKNRAIFIEKWKDLETPQALWLLHLIEKARLDAEKEDKAGQKWALERAFSLSPGNREILELYENFLNNNGKEGEILSILKQYHAIRPDDAEVCNLIGVRLWENGEVSKAISYFQQAWQHHPENPQYMKNLADAYLTTEQFEEAIALYIHLIRTHPKDMDAYQRLADLYIEDGNFQAAAELLDAALSHQPNNETLLEKRRLLNTPRLYVAHQLVMQGEKEAASQLLSECVKEDGEQLKESELRLISKLYREMGDSEQARLFEEKADAAPVISPV